MHKELVPNGEVDTKKVVLRRYCDTGYLMFRTEEEAETYFDGGCLARGIFQNDLGEWGHWKHNHVTGEKTWKVIEIPDDVKDYRVTHPFEILRERLFDEIYMEAVEKFDETGLEPHSNEFREYHRQRLDEELAKYESTLIKETNPTQE